MKPLDGREVCWIFQGRACPFIGKPGSNLVRIEASQGSITVGVGEPKLVGGCILGVGVVVGMGPEACGVCRKVVSGPRSGLGGP